MAFDLHIEFSGLCLFVRDRAQPDVLEVLMPPADGHFCIGEDMQGQQTRVPHGMIVGYDRKFEGGTAGTCNDFTAMHHGLLDLRGLRVQSRSLQVVLPSIVDITSLVAGKRLRPDRAHARIVLDSGTACDLGICGDPPGGLWTLPSQHAQLMATAVRWVIPGVTEQVDGADGLSLKILNLDGTPKLTLPTLRPLPAIPNPEIRIHVYHTCVDEFPCAGPIPAEDLPAGTPAPHFRAYYCLFEGMDACCDGSVPCHVPTSEETTELAFAAADAGRRLGCIGTTVEV